MILSSVNTILNRALAGKDISPEDGVTLLTQTEPAAVAAIQETADQLRHKQAGDTVTYIINRNINFTNICEQHCSFCAFRRDAGTEGAYWLDWGQIVEKTADAVQRRATEICMQGGLNPEAKLNGGALPYYLQLVKTIKQEFPQLHLHAFSPQEVQFIAQQDGQSYADVIVALRDTGVGSMPGTAAEVLDDNVRRILCPEKTNTATWLEIVETAHQLGMPTTSTMLSGHIETPEQQMGHLEKLRSLQQTALDRGYPGYITEFILLPFIGQDAPKPLRRRVGHDQPVLEDALLLTAVARIFLGNWIPNHQPSWVKLGLDGATEALRWGCNDIGGTLMEEHITTMAGAKGGTCMEVETLQGAITSLGRPYQQRDTLYQHLQTPLNKPKNQPGVQTPG
ncbi:MULTISPECIES: 7,8-didemethyl-8-hydroxy-5-deazariboflavin synthase subunit CofH [unclassified Coleofasciculus]|uniref:7,8-didemethyl-8-hydroxy-5-deazariboflavin synthase subunit CofH n=1 Tax=unclassified Coleofasciculus TaxID=2692782 RepID=UPI001882F0D9|nr:MULTISPECIES: 7,8-didemethyl-8-hydroxy-5-deazariboflavin synthase subunit CofH [unclassified Coleofasciculus]MBE9124687.1 7,8-didemethyl-8-hydroxy-5-deazariboflavin synthase subunit CofH [Coleofasciculus sp. LEGE 07081]MBE9147014.1 7,8-didemethyl-8-hydroxy-5-deazariboflavin synthase subunit CofH [Coleofasciculus sp. LEGE 07092]